MTEQFENEPVMDLRHYITVVRSHRWLALSGVAIMVGLALAWSLSRTPLYTAQARVFVQSITTEPGGYIPPANLNTESSLVKSVPVATLVNQDLDLKQDPASLLQGLTVATVPLSDIMSITYTSPDGSQSAQLANSFAANYLEYRRDRALRSLLAAQQDLQSQISTGQEQLDDVTLQIEQEVKQGSGALLNQLELQQTTLVTHLALLQQRLEDLNPDRTIRLGGGEVIQEASVPLEPSSPNHISDLLLGLFLGLVLGIGLAFVRERLDNRFRSREDVEEIMAVPVLGTVPSFRVSRNEALAALPLLGSTGSIAAEQYRALRTNVQFIAAQRDIHSLLVTSSASGEGKTVTSSNLAISLAQVNKRVILVSADLRKPTVERLFGLSRRNGLSDWLIGEKEDSWWSYLRDPGIDNLRLMTAGTMQQNPAELLTSPRIVELFSRLQENADFVIIDSPPVLPVADASILGSRVDGTIIVVTSTTERSAAAHAKRELERVGSKVIGVVMNNLNPRTPKYKYYDPYRSYGYAEYSVEPENQEDASQEGKPRTRRGRKTVA